MKKLFLLLITLTTFSNVSFASFPIIVDTLEMKIDTLQTDEIKQYHDHLIDMGIDLNSCKCESCRIGIAPLTRTKTKFKPFLAKDSLLQLSKKCPLSSPKILGFITSKPPIGVFIISIYYYLIFQKPNIEK